MNKTFKVYKLDRNDITEVQFEQIIAVEKTGSDDCYTEEQLKEIWVDSDKNDNFVCIDNDKIVAHVSFNPYSQRRNGSIYMVNLVVLPEYRRQGIAQKLINAGCEYYLERGYTLPISTSVDKDNIPALALYQKIGFEIREPICELDYDDSQYILDSSLAIINNTISSKSKIYK